MKIRNAKLTLGLIVVLGVFFTACNTPIKGSLCNGLDIPCAPCNCEPPDPGRNDAGGGGVTFGVVSFDTDGGIPTPRDLNIAWGSKVGRLRPMERGTDGFFGWFDENENPWDVETRPVNPEDDVNGDGFILLKARWSAISHIVSFVTTPSVTSVANQTVASGGNIIPPVEPTAPGDGRGFAGWFTDDGTGGNWGTQWNFANDVVYSSITLYAKWEYNTRTVIFQVNGGTRPDGTDLTRTHFTIPVSYGLIQDPGPLVKTGYSFGGWFTDTAYTNQWEFAVDRVTVPDTVPGSDPLYLYAMWFPNVYFVSFDVNSATASQLPRQEVTHGQKATKPSVVNPGMAVIGWFTSRDYATEWVFGRDVVTSTMTLYAKWDVETTGDNGGNSGNGAAFGVVTFDTSGGVPTPKDLNIAWGNTVGRLRPIERGADGFVGWFDENEKPWDVETRQVKPEDDVNGDGFISLKARWTPASYIVSFIVSPSLAVIPDQSVANGGYIVQPVNPTVGDGRSFAGWFTEDGAGGNWGRQWDFAKDTVSGAITLYAMWSTYQTRTVVFQVNGGTRPDGTELTRTHFTIPISYGVIQDPGPLVRAGHSFGGWFTDLAFTNQWNFSVNKVTYPDEAPGVDPLYLYARWIPNIYSVTFDVNSTTASQPDKQDIAHGERAARPTVTNPGMVLVGWYTDWKHTTKWDFDNDMVSSSMILYADWEVAVYTVTFNLRMPAGNAAHPQPADQSVLYNGKLSEPFMPPLAAEDTSSWSFYRWDYSTNGSDDPATFQPWNFNTGVTAHMTLHARWAPPVPDMVWVPRGSFTMGDSGVSGSPAAYHSYPTHRVTMDGFYIGRYPVTQEQFESVMTDNSFGITANPSQFRAGQTERPVERVSWFDAIAYANTLSETTPGLLKAFAISSWTTEPNVSSASISNITDALVDINWATNGFRLPTEAEWEFAARGGHDSPGNFSYAGSDNATDVAWFNTNSGSQTHAKGSKAPNALGIYDMNGNVSEWCWDWFDSYKSIIASHPGVEAYNNPKGAAAGAERVRRGGSWNNAAGNVRNVVRSSATPGSANWVIGFRLARNAGMDEIY